MWQFKKSSSRTARNLSYNLSPKDSICINVEELINIRMLVYFWRIKIKVFAKRLELKSMSEALKSWSISEALEWWSISEALK